MTWRQSLQKNLPAVAELKAVAVRKGLRRCLDENGILAFAKVQSQAQSVLNRLQPHARSGAAQLFSEFAVGAYITAAYWFTASTSFANPAVTLARAASDTFAGIRPVDAPGFILAQLAGAAGATILFRWLTRVEPGHAPDILEAREAEEVEVGEKR